jgi:hypothetical protein
MFPLPSLCWISTHDYLVEFLGSVCFIFESKHRPQPHPVANDRSPAIRPATEFARFARWVRPELGGEVAYAEIGLEGRLRHPRWRGLRER